MTRHEHQAAAGGPDDGAGPDWFRALDLVVWVSVAIIGALAVEWLIGYLLRERLAAGASRHLAKVAAKSDPPATA